MHWPLQEKRKVEIDPVRFLFSCHAILKGLLGLKETDHVPRPGR